ncbi:MAG TPA: HAD hydrolase-like protein [Methylophilaceae bacterium]|nr:HAD hydrolase-like protein [Methylophilaceae bacterium]
MQSASPTRSSVIFDLDGTLIDSSASILRSFEAAFDKTGVIARQPFTSEAIGPPLIPTLKRLAGSDDPVLIQALAAAFKAEYDNHAYQAATVFDGIPELLATLRQRGVQMYIATNKRILPTHKILTHLGWQDHFAGIYGLDYFEPVAASKTEMVARIIERHALTPGPTLFVGDRIEDGIAAEGNGLDFAMVTWGYLDDTQGERSDNWQYFDDPHALGIYIIS